MNAEMLNTLLLHVLERFDQLLAGFNSVHNINLRTVIGYHKDDQEYNFLDDYDEWGRKDADGEDRKGFFEKSES